MDDAVKSRDELLEEIATLRRAVASARGAPVEVDDEPVQASVLVVDDHPANLVALEAVLEPLGVRVVRAGSGREALERLLREDFAVILLDVQMPGMDGFETAALIRTRERTREVPIVFVTAIHHDNAYRARGYARGAVDYISKPFDPDVLRSKVSALVELWRRGEHLRRREARLFAHEREDLLAREKRARAEAEAERARFRTLIMEAPAAITILTGPQHVYALLNAQGAQLLGGRDVLGKPAREALPGADPVMFARLDEVYRTGTPHIGREVPFTLDWNQTGVASTRYFDHALQPMRNARGEVEGLASFAVDVTDKVTSREALEREQALLAASEARARRLQDSGVIGVVFWTREGRIVDANDAFLRIVGYTREDLASGALRWTEMTPPEFAQLDARAFAELDATGVCTPYEKEYVRKDGRRVPILLGVACWEGSRTDGVAWIVDITQRRRLEAEREALLAAAKSGEERFRFLADASTALAGSLDVGTTLAQLARLAVPALADWFSVYLREPGAPAKLVAVTHVDPPKEVLLREIAERYPLPPDAPRGYPYVIRTGTSELLEEITAPMREAIARDARHHELLEALGARSAMTVPLRVGGRTFGAIAFVAVAGPRPRYTAADLHLAEELAHRIAAALDNARLYETAQRERARAEEASRAKDDFLATLSHELRTPMTAILGWSRMLATGAVSDERRPRALETIERNARAQAQLIDDLLDFSRIVSGKLKLHMEPVALAAVIEAAVETVRPAADARGVRLDTLLDDAGAPIVGDAARLQQVAWNLLSNAVKFTPRSGRVTVTVRRTEAHVELVVADTGQGIDAAFLPHVFERFRQADASTTRQHGGLGLGLSIVRHLVELHGGRVEAQSDGPGTGATFRVYLPLASARARSAPPAAHAEAQRGRAGALECPAELAGLHVLVVDDEPDAREFVASVLEHCRARVTTVASAAEAMSALAIAPPDVLVSDIGMPGEDGYALVRRVRALPPEHGGETPAVALTAFARTEDRMRALSAGFNSHVAKPVEPQELLVVIANLAARLRGRSGSGAR